MRILVVSDLHYRLPHYDWLVGRPPTSTSVALAGDLADVVSPVPHRRADGRARQLPRGCSRPGPGPRGLRQPRPRRSRWARRAGGRVAAPVATDGAARRRRGRRRRRHAVHGVPLVGRAGDPRRGRRAARRGGRRPAGALGLALPRTAGRHAAVPRRPAEFPDQELAAWIEQHQPDLVLCGHIHQAPWADGGVVARPARATPGCSTPASRSVPSRRTSPSTPRRARRTGIGVFESGRLEPGLTAVHGHGHRRGRGRIRWPSGGA